MKRFYRKTLVVLAMTFLHNICHAQHPLGATWGPTYGFPPYNAQNFLPSLREMSLGFSRVTLYWSQLEPKQGVHRWIDLDSYVAQLKSPEEGFITLASASPWATRSKTWVFPSSPALDRDQYYAFVQDLVVETKGKVRYFQGETEPNNSFFWAGSAAEYAKQQQVFYRAVKDANPDAVVVLAGCDGLFDPTGRDPLPGQDATVAFFRNILTDVQGAFDVFDVHLYGDPYTIPDRIEFLRKLMHDSGADRPMLAAEYGGPSFFEFKTNRRWFGQLQGPNASPDAVRALRAQASELPNDTRMFVTPDDPEMSARLLRLKTEDLVVRNLLALSSGIIKTAFFSVWHDTKDQDNPNTMLFGSFSLLEHNASGALTKPLPIAGPLARLASALQGEINVHRVVLEDSLEIFVFRIDRQGRRPLLIGWRRPTQLGGSAEPLTVSIAWDMKPRNSSTMDGRTIAVRYRKGKIIVALSEMPALIE